MGNDSSAASPIATGETSRRRLLAFLGAGGVAALASLFSRDAAQAGHDGTNVLHLGEVNGTPPGKKTGVASDVNSFAFDIDNYNTGEAGGLHGRSLGAWPALQGVGHEPSFAGVFGVSSPASGELGTGSRTGVMGLSGTGVGVEGVSQSGTGVRARSDTPAGIALVVDGTSRFSTAGSAVIAGGEDAHFVPNPAVTGESHISLTLAGDPGQSQISWIEQDPGSGFTVHLSRPLRRGQDVPLTYLIVEPA